eukprot:CAMPEP_0171105296 /NCGR_PEP_ID=MMETSP0766_2-20121228/62378_1 /TAXON_ID=439317 /ORGANISM="Gambierdiscus australes, Strain CAWD 149" /LENGTH=259 /DNA_ID=CAMNT_0011566111 /DNA_START=53 /DNA_END=832 /DNA_ORIENTATION=+
MVRVQLVALCIWLVTGAATRDDDAVAVIQQVAQLQAELEEVPTDDVQKNEINSTIVPAGEANASQRTGYEEGRPTQNKITKSDWLSCGNLTDNSTAPFPAKFVDFEFDVLEAEKGATASVQVPQGLCEATQAKDKCTVKLSDGAPDIVLDVHMEEALPSGPGEAKMNLDVEIWLAFIKITRSKTSCNICDDSCFFNTMNHDIEWPQAQCLQGLGTHWNVSIPLSRLTEPPSGVRAEFTVRYNRRDTTALRAKLSANFKS